MLKLERLKKLLTYNPETGEFHWLVSKGAAKAGSLAGTRTTQGYWQLCIDGKLYKAHVIAWFMYHGVKPSNIVDHRDLDRMNNRIKNLREATAGQNEVNKKVNPRNKLGVKGVVFEKRSKTNPFVAFISLGGVRKNLGGYPTIEEAKAVYDHHLQQHYGEYARA